MSVLLPPNAKSALEDLKSTARSNGADLMFDVLNEKFNENPQNFIFENDIHSTDDGNISFAYRHRLKPLKPDADKVVAAIQSVLHIQ